jgi:hypothetical protein
LLPTNNEYFPLSSPFRHRGGISGSPHQSVGCSTPRHAPRGQHRLGGGCKPEHATVISNCADNFITNVLGQSNCRQSVSDIAGDQLNTKRWSFDGQLIRCPRLPLMQPV